MSWTMCSLSLLAVRALAVTAAQGDEGDDGLAFEIIGTTDDSGFSDMRMTDERAFDFSGADGCPATLSTSSTRPMTHR